MTVRVLIMGRAAVTWSTRLGEIAGGALEVDVARLPAEGIRRFEATPPDLLVVVDEVGGQRARTLIQAIQNRPLGRLLPMFLISKAPDAAATPAEIAASLDIDAWFPQDITPYELLKEIAAALEYPLHDLRGESLPPDVPPTAQRVAEHSDFVIERLEQDTSTPPRAHDDRDANPPKKTEEEATAEEVEEADEPERVEFVPPPSPVARVSRSSLFPVRHSEVRQGEVSEEALRRKLKEARHEDYYIILEVRRGAETAVLRESHQRLMARFDPARLDFDLVRRFYEEIAEIRDALDDAWAVLGDPDLRQTYMTQSASSSR